MTAPDRIAVNTIRASCPARAALAGNPSDGYGGAVFAVPVRAWAATVELSLGDSANAAPHDSVLTGAGPTDGRALVDAAHRSWRHFVDSARCPRPLPPLEELHVRVTTSIPRSVGLAGSSAIIIAALRTFAACTNVSIGNPCRDGVTLDELATIAWWAENELLDIACGLQDRVVQTYDRPMLMDFAPDHGRVVLGHPAGSYRPVDTPPDGAARWRLATSDGDAGALFVAARPTAAESSGVLHGRLRREAAAEQIDVMRRLRAAAHDAAFAFASGDHARLGVAMRTSFQLRRTELGVDPVTTDLADRAATCGAAANTTGSGGSVVVLAPDERSGAAARAALSEVGCACVDIDVG